MNSTMDDSPMREKRLRRKREAFDYEPRSSKEEQLIAKALKNSLQHMYHATQTPVPAPVYYPTLIQFKDPLQYIAS